MEADASDFASGGVLRQKQQGKWRVIAYRSSAFSDAERNYEIYDKEMLAIIESLKGWRHFTMETSTPVSIFTDHNNLKYFMSIIIN